MGTVFAADGVWVSRDVCISVNDEWCTDSGDRVIQPVIVKLTSPPKRAGTHGFAVSIEVPR